jgi:hypothetical protein
MTDETKPDRKSILDQVRDETVKAKRDAAKQAVKAKYADLIKAKQVVAGIEDDIVGTLIEAGENAEGVRAILASE